MPSPPDGDTSPNPSGGATPSVGALPPACAARRAPSALRKLKSPWLISIARPKRRWVAPYLPRSVGPWQQLHFGVYATLTGKPPPDARLWAAVLRAGPQSILSHETAAELHGLTD